MTTRQQRMTAIERLAIRQQWLAHDDTTLEFLAMLTGRPISTLHSIVKPVSTRAGDVNAKMYAAWRLEASSTGIGWDKAVMTAAAIRTAWFRVWAETLAKPAGARHVAA